MSDLGSRTARGGMIAVVAQAVRMLVTIVGFAVLARLLTPDDFGLVAMALTVTAFIVLFSENSLPMATVQRHELDQDTTSGLFVLNLLIGFGLMLVTVFAFAPLAALLYGDERVQDIIVALAATIPIATAGVQHRALLQRGMRWLPLKLIEVSSLSVGVVLAISVAWFTDAGYWALVVQHWTTVTLTALLPWFVSGWRPSRVRTWSGARVALRFSLNLSGFHFVNYLVRTSDNILIGWRWGATDLGYYSRAYNLLQLPIQLINGPLSHAIVPGLSRLQKDPVRWREFYLKSLFITCFFYCAFAAIMVANARDIILIVYGPQWEVTADIFFYLSFSMFPIAIGYTAGWIFVSLGQTDRQLRLALLRLPIFLLGFVVALPYGPTAVAMAWAGVVTLLLYPNILFVTRQAPVQPHEIFSCGLPFIVAGIVAVLIGPHLFAPPVHEWLVISIAMKCSVVMSIYVVLILAALVIVPPFGRLARDLVREAWRDSTKPRPVDG